MTPIYIFNQINYIIMTKLRKKYDSLSKPVHTVFNVSEDKVLGVVDEVWSMRSSVTPILKNNGYQEFKIPMGKVVGTNGETNILIVVKDGTSEIISAYSK